jgi:hypothetical protein
VYKTLGFESLALRPRLFSYNRAEDIPVQHNPTTKLSKESAPLSWRDAFHQAVGLSAILITLKTIDAYFEHRTVGTVIRAGFFTWLVMGWVAGPLILVGTDRLGRYLFRGVRN